MNKKAIKINRDIATPAGRKRAGDIISIDCDANDVPLNKFWRDRVKDSAIDNCVEFLETREQQLPDVENIKFNKKKKNK